MHDKIEDTLQVQRNAEKNTRLKKISDVPSFEKGNSGSELGHRKMGKEYIYKRLGETRFKENDFNVNWGNPIQKNTRKPGQKNKPNTSF